MFSIIYYIGLIACLAKLRVIFDFVWFYFLRPTNRWEKYLQGPSPYAVVTGATDGIGKATARDLYNKGFNLILHGRNEKKLKGVIEEIQSTKSKRTGKVQDVKYFLEDASKAGIDFEGIARRFEGLNVTILVNNVGGYSIRPERFGHLVSLSVRFCADYMTRVWVGSTNVPRKNAWNKFEPTPSSHCS